MNEEAEATGDHGPGGAAVIFDPVRYGTGRAYAAAIDRISLAERARAAIVANMADPDLRPATLARSLGVEVEALRDALRPSGTVRATIAGIRLDAALLALASWPLSTRLVTDVAHAHGYSDRVPFGSSLQRRFGRSPSEVMAMRAVWLVVKFRGWLEEQADRYGFKDALDGVEVDRRPMVRAMAAS